MSDDFAALRALAEKATPGPWKHWEHTNRIYSPNGRPKGEPVSVCAVLTNTFRGQDSDNIAYIAACSPDVISRLLAAAEERDRLRVAHQRTLDEVDKLVACCDRRIAERDAERARAERAEKEAELQARATEDWHARWQRACDRLAEESARAERLAAALREVDMDLTCRDDDDAHYCPNCDRSLFRLRMYIRAVLAGEPEGK